MFARLNHETLISFAISAMLTSVFISPAPSSTSAAGAGPQPQAIMNAFSGLHAMGWAGTQEMMVPESVASPESIAATATNVSKPILTADRQKKLAVLMTTYGHDVALNPLITVALGISTGNQILTLRQLAVNDHPHIHAYVPLPDGGVMLGFVDDIAAWNYRLDANLKLVAAISKSDGAAPKVIDTPDAEQNVETELSYWAAIADKH